MLIDHVPQGNPCSVCGESAFKHRAEHRPVGNPCVICGLDHSRHRIRTRKQPSKQQTIFLGIDGEGQGRKNHVYNFLAASDETGTRQWWVEPCNQDELDNGISTVRCFDFLLNLPQHNTKAFTYSFGYDLTKMFKDMPDEKIYLLVRPELRQRPGKEAMKGPYPVRWNGYMLNLQGTKFTIAKGSRYRVVWDTWKFFQSKFTAALTDWKVGDKEMLERMTHMKDKRADFDKVKPEDVRAYCLEECRYMAELARKLYNAHVAAGLKLKSFYGAGSTSSAMLHTMGIKDKIRPAPKSMNRAVASAFFGGRFENSVIGEVEGPVYNYDISSAYPYQLCFMPCLIHGKWRHTKERYDVEQATCALVRYSLPFSEHCNPRISPDMGGPSWGPFPFRTSDGCISFPVQSAGGWVWSQEFLAGERYFPNVEFHEAWLYHTDCDCKPFNRIPDFYLERLKIGKEGPGIVLKLGMNGGYGKLAQSVGKGIFNCWVWAGMITSNTRAQLLELLSIHQHHHNCLMMATDGVQSRELLVTPIPMDTGTDIPILDTSNGKTVRKPLGGWERKDVPQGVFYGRPGIYFPLNPTKEEIKDIRGRGVGKGVVLENHEKILNSWRKYGVHKTVQIANVSRFCGAKSSISRTQVSTNPERRSAGVARGSAGAGGWVYKRADGTQKLTKEEKERGKQNVSYGQWVTREVTMSFNPLPKREKVNPDGMTLMLRAFGDETASMPYAKAMRSFEAKALQELAQELSEQPDVDMADYEPVDEV